MKDIPCIDCIWCIKPSLISIYLKEHLFCNKSKFKSYEVYKPKNQLILRCCHD